MSAGRQRVDLLGHLVPESVGQGQTVDHDRFSISIRHQAALCFDFFLDPPASALPDALLSEEDDDDEELDASELELDPLPGLPGLSELPELLELSAPSEPELVPPLFAPLLPYPSAYQPPPFRMKFGAESRRFAWRLLHFGHVLIGSSVMRCSRSNSNPHFPHW
jgi:hypothetical protein